MEYSEVSSGIFTKVYAYAKAHGLLETAVAKKIFVSSYFLYKRLLEDSFAAVVKKYPELFAGGHILDVGANLGYTAKVFARALSPGCKVFAFEPEKENFESLAQLAATRALRNLVVPYQLAVGEANGSIELWHNHAHHADHRVMTPGLKERLHANADTYTVPLVSLDNWRRAHCEGQSISFIKIDVQGYELCVCRGMAQILEECPLASVAIEYSPLAFEEMGFPADAVIEFFTSRGIALYVVQANGRLKAFDASAIAADLRSRGYVDLIATRKAV